MKTQLDDLLGNIFWGAFWGSILTGFSIWGAALGATIVFAATVYIDRRDS